MTKSEQNAASALERARQSGHEARDANICGVVMFCIGLLVLVGLSLWLSYWLALVLAGQDTPPEFGVGQEVGLMFADPQSNQHLLRQQQQAARREVLESYKWIDRDQGIATIPIERAIELMASRESLSLSPEKDEGNAQEQ